MTRPQRLLLRTAIAIHEQLRLNQVERNHVALPASAWQQCELLNRKWQKAVRRDWRLAAKRLERELHSTIERLRVELAEVGTPFQVRTEESQKTSLGEIYSDLVALGGEFEKVSFDRRGHTLSVTTEAIELEGVYLGPFEICLDWGDLTAGHPDHYRVIAVAPNPAAANENVTHPHVQDEAVCEGEARQPIRRALEQGRLLDFFMIVASLLRTYNSSSPFVSLSDWHGVECADCGSSVCSDERWTCENCTAAVCGECYYNCPGCDGIFCYSCVTRCEACEENHCSGCLKACLDCDAAVCQSCLDENERCPDCHDQKHEEERKEMEADRKGDGEIDSGTPLQPDRLGQITVPA